MHPRTLLQPTLSLSDTDAWVPWLLLVLNVPDAQDCVERASGSSCSPPAQCSGTCGGWLPLSNRWRTPARTLLSLPHQSNPRGAHAAFTETDHSAELPQLICLLYTTNPSSPSRKCFPWKFPVTETDRTWRYLYSSTGTKVEGKTGQYPHYRYMMPTHPFDK